MKLYFSPGACSLSAHIVLREAGLQFDLDQVDLRAKKTADGKDFYAISPNGYVPALQLKSGEVLTEGPAIVQYLADLVPDKNLAAPQGSMERYHLMESLNFITSELHKTFTPLFIDTTVEETRNAVRATLGKRIAFVNTELGKSSFFRSEHFSVADAYLFTVLSWARYVKFDLSPWPAVVSYLERIATRPAVHEAMVAEGLIKG
jgi:glutathione S-transferase